MALNINPIIFYETLSIQKKNEFFKFFGGDLSEIQYSLLAIISIQLS